MDQQNVGTERSAKSISNLKANNSKTAIFNNKKEI
jgi:hypothetical protein